MLSHLYVITFPKPSYHSCQPSISLPLTGLSFHPSTFPHLLISALQGMFRGKSPCKGLASSLELHDKTHPPFHHTVLFYTIKPSCQWELQGWAFSLCNCSFLMLPDSAIFERENSCHLGKGNPDLKAVPLLVEFLQRPYMIETIHSYTFPMKCLFRLYLSLLTDGTAVCGHS